MLIDVHHASLNFGELAVVRTGHGPKDFIPGWDASGIVVKAAEDGSGPAVGQRVLTFGGTTGWAQQRAVDTHNVAVVPDEIDLAIAAALPVAGVTALQALRAAGPTLGRRILVTSAAGGVGRFAVQLAALGGASEVIASVGSEGRKAGLDELGADQVIVNLEGLEGEVDIVIENVGGETLLGAYQHLASEGSLQSVGWVSGEPLTLPPYTTVGPAKSITSFYMSKKIGKDMAFLLDLVRKDLLQVDIGWQGPWDRVAEAADALFARKVTGKAILDIR
jgi:NADPH:quinone reductase-like Zn-dependent oxidoreductase